MVGFRVKITTKWNPFDLLCPHYCRGCGKIGAVFCECCKNDINITKMKEWPNNQEKFLDKIFMVGWHDDVVGELIKEFKYNSVRALADVLADFLDESLPIFKDDIVLVPLPTIARHVRQRGFDHTGLIVRKLAKKRGYMMKKCLVRNKNTVQVGSDGEKRREQAKKAYKINGLIKKGKIYLLVDDVWTTGASMIEAAKIMKKAGAEQVMAAVLAVNRGKNKRSGFGGIGRATTEGVEYKIDDGVR